jgi:glycosyltransferase involved in cell wall biosynthesis
MGGGDVAATARVVAARIHDPEILIRHSVSPDPLPDGVGALWDELLEAADVRVERTPVRHVRGLKPLDPGPSPDVSIVIPCHDDGRFLGDAVASALLSEEPVPEIVIVDDGSSDPETIAVLRILTEAGFRVVRQENRGLGAARNTGIHASRGRYILPLDADNLLRPAYIPAALEVLEAEPRVGVVYGDALYFGSRRGRWSVGPFDPVRLAAGNFIDACAVFRREVWEETGGYDEEMALLGHQDWDLWLGAAERDWQLRWVERPLFDYRVRPGSMTSRLFGEDVRRALWTHVATKHRALFNAHLPDILARCDLALHEAAVRIEELSSPVPRVARCSVERLPDEAFHLEWVASELPVSAGTGEVLRVSVTVRNTSTTSWPDLASARADGWFAVRLGFRWWREDRVLGEDGRGELSSPLPPGKTTTIDAHVTAPMTPGTYRLQVDMLQEMVAWFETKGAPRLETAVLVTERPGS